MNVFLLRILIIPFILTSFNTAIAMSELEETAIFAFKGNSKAMNSLVNKSNSGDAEAQMWLGTYHYTKNEYAKALVLFKKSSLQMNTQAIFNLARMYDKGLGVKKNLIKAKKLYLISAEKGYAHAQHNVGNMYLLGEGTIKNPQEALKWLLLAGQQGQRSAQRDLGALFIEGKHVKRNLVLAYTYMSLAAINNEPNASAAAARIKHIMTPSEIKKATRFINQAKAIRNQEIKNYMNEIIKKQEAQ